MRDSHATQAVIIERKGTTFTELAIIAVFTALMVVAGITFAQRITQGPSVISLGEESWELSSR